MEHETITGRAGSRHGLPDLNEEEENGRGVPRTHVAAFFLDELAKATNKQNDVLQSFNRRSSAQQVSCERLSGVRSQGGVRLGNMRLTDLVLWPPAAAMHLCSRSNRFGKFRDSRSLCTDQLTWTRTSCAVNVQELALCLRRHRFQKKATEFFSTTHVRVHSCGAGRGSLATGRQTL